VAAIADDRRRGTGHGLLRVRSEKLDSTSGEGEQLEQEPTRTYYPIGFTLDGQDRFFLWYTMDVPENGPDRVLLDPDGFLLTFDEVEALHAYVCSEGLILDPAIPSTWFNLDFDAVEAWCASPTTNSIECDEFLGAWNMMDDVLLTMGRAKLLHDGQQAYDDGVYDKLFWGTNPPALKPDDADDFEPVWTSEEMEIIVAAFSRGLRNFRSILRA
jgi:hypothetical protein